MLLRKENDMVGRKSWKDLEECLHERRNETEGKRRGWEEMKECQKE